MIKSLHCLGCTGSFIEAAVDPNTGKVPACCLSSQILSVCYGPQGAETHTRTPSCRCSADGWRAHSYGQRDQLRLYEQAVGRVRGVLGGRLTSSISCWPCTHFSSKRQVKSSCKESLHPTAFWTSLHQGAWMNSELLLFRLQAKIPILVSFSHWYIFMHSTVAKDFSVPNWHGRVH